MTWLKHCVQVAYKINSDKDFDPQPPVFAILTDLRDFYFFSHDGLTFNMDKEIHVSSATRVEFFNGMGDGLLLISVCRNIHAKLLAVMERSFSMILQGYIAILEAVVKRFTTHGVIGDVSSTTFLLAILLDCNNEWVGM